MKNPKNHKNWQKKNEKKNSFAYIMKLCQNVPLPCPHENELASFFVY